LRARYGRLSGWVSTRSTSFREATVSGDGYCGPALASRGA